MKITSLKITSYPDKMEYFVGDQIDLSGLKMEACYDNGINMEVVSGFSCSVKTFSDEGSQMVTENGKPVDESEYSTELSEENGKSVLKVKTKHGELVCETPYDEYEKLNSGDVYSEAIGVDENGNTFKEVVVVGNGTNEPTTAKAE